MDHLGTNSFDMKDITKKIKSAISQNVLWALNMFYDFIEQLRAYNIQVSYWEGEENWATLIIAEKPIGYLWKKYPLFIVEENQRENLSEILEKNNFISVILVKNLNDEILSLNYNDLKDFFDYGLDYNKFSATDLWFQTNSIQEAAKGEVKETVEQVGKNFNKISDNLLKKFGIDAHQLKRDFLGKKAQISKYDLYKDTKTGEIQILQKGGKGNPIQTGEFLKQYVV